MDSLLLFHTSFSFSFPFAFDCAFAFGFGFGFGFASVFALASGDGFDGFDGFDGLLLPVGSWLAGSGRTMALVFPSGRFPGTGT